MARRDDILTTLITIIGSLPKVGPVSAGSRPIGDCGLESADGVAIAVELEIELGITIPDNENPFVDDRGGRRRARTVGQMAAWLEKKERDAT